MSKLQCRICQKPLYGGLDTFGPVGQEVCLFCDLQQSYQAEREPAQRTGYIIGFIAPEHRAEPVEGHEPGCGWPNYLCSCEHQSTGTWHIQQLFTPEEFEEWEGFEL